MKPPFFAAIPAVGVMVVSHYSAWFPLLSTWLIQLFVVTMALILGFLLAGWLSGSLRVEDVHSGYFLPTVAGPFIASISLSKIGADEIATAAFGVGLFFWVVLGSVLLLGSTPPIAVVTGAKRTRLSTNSREAWP